MTYMLDTSVAISLRDGDSTTMTRIAALTRPLVISMLTRVELENGVYRDPAHIASRRVRLDAILPSLPALPFDDSAAVAYSAIIASLGYSRRNMIDRMIAAQAIVHRATIVTRNEADFAVIPGLASETW